MLKSPPGQLASPGNMRTFSLGRDKKSTWEASPAIPFRGTGFLPHLSYSVSSFAPLHKTKVYNSIPNLPKWTFCKRRENKSPCPLLFLNKLEIVGQSGQSTCWLDQALVRFSLPQHLLNWTQPWALEGRADPCKGPSKKLLTWGRSIQLHNCSSQPPNTILSLVVFTLPYKRKTFPIGLRDTCRSNIQGVLPFG